MSEPLRMCLSCKKMQQKRSLIRIVKTKDAISIDDTFKAAGRGAYVCACPDCVGKLCKYKLLNKAFKCEVPPEIYSAIEEKANER